MGKKKNVLSNINSILLSTSNLKHTLQLYTPNVNKYAIQIPFLAMAEDDEKIIYVTNEKPESVIEELKGLNIKPTIISPHELNKLSIEKKAKTRIVVDGESFDRNADHIQREKLLNDMLKTHSILSNHSLLCTYVVTKIRPNIIKELADCHDKLIFTTSDATIVSSESFDKLGITSQAIEKFVKNDLELIILALIMNKPMCGLDIIKSINKSFNVLLSPGTVYPLLHSLKKKGLLECTLGIKKKLYKPAKGAEGRIEKILNRHVQTSVFMNNFLQWGDTKKSGKIPGRLLT